MLILRIYHGDLNNRSYEILVDPNQYKKVEVPIVVVGEVNGMVYLNTEGKLKRIGTNYHSNI
jgi:hypothetical protein